MGEIEMNQQSVISLLLRACISGAVVLGGAEVPANAESTAPIHPTMDKIATAQVPFIRNQGQVSHSEVAFYARMFAGALFVTDDGQLVYALQKKDSGGSSAGWAFRESFADRNPSQPTGGRRSDTLVSHFKGQDPNAWKSQLETYDSVNLGEVYPGIQVSLNASGNNVEKLFHVAPGADVGAIRIAIDGAQGMSVNALDQLVLATKLGEIVFTAPIAYQVVDEERRPVAVAYTIDRTQSYGFDVGAYDKSRELVIDPLLASTFIGGHNDEPPGNYDDDIVHGIAVAGGDIYIAGATQSPDFPVYMGYDETLGSEWPDGFVTRMSGDLSTVVASTYFDTEWADRVTDIALDDTGTVVVVGQAGYGFPVTDGAYTWNGSGPTGGGFVARFSADLSTLLASSVPTPGDYPQNIAIGNDGLYFGGSTNNPDFPITPGAYLSTCCAPGSFGIREYDGFAGKLSTDLATLQAMTYLGGNTVSGIAVAPDNSLFITDGWDHAITGYIARFDGALTGRQAHLTYYPGSASGSSRTYFNDVAAADGYVVVGGQTYMNDLPATAGAFDVSCGSDGLCDGVGPLVVPKSDGFVAIYSNDLQNTLALTYLGGSDHESIRSVAVGSDGGVFVTGETTSVDFPTAGDGPDTTCGTDSVCNAVGSDAYSDGFVARLTADLSQLDYGSYLGGSDEDQPLVIVLDDVGLAYAAGYTVSSDFPTTTGAFDPSYNGGTSDAFISWIDAGSGLIFADDFEIGDIGRWNGN